MNLTELRQNLYRIVDEVLETGEPVEIVRRGRTVRIVPDSETSVWGRLEVHQVFPSFGAAAVEDVHWEQAWDGEPELDDPSS